MPTCWPSDRAGLQRNRPSEHPGRRRSSSQRSFHAAAQMFASLAPDGLNSADARRPAGPTKLSARPECPAKSTATCQLMGLTRPTLFERRRVARHHGAQRVDLGPSTRARADARQRVAEEDRRIPAALRAQSPAVPKTTRSTWKAGQDAGGRRGDRDRARALECDPANCWLHMFRRP
jgi:hypothetical protein